LPETLESGVHYVAGGGAIILKKVQLPESVRGKSIFVEVVQYSDGDAYDRTGSVFVIPTDKKQSFLDAIRDLKSVPSFTSGKDTYHGLVSTPDYNVPVELMRFFTGFGVRKFNHNKVPGQVWVDSVLYKSEVTALSDHLHGEAWIAAYYAGDALTMIYNAQLHGVNLDFYYPTNDEGMPVTNVFADAMCIPTGISEENKEHAEAYITFMLTEEIATANAEYIYYGTPNSLVTSNPHYLEYLGDDFYVIYDEDIEENIDVLFSEYAYRNLPQDKLILLNKLWEELKVDSSNFGGGLYIISGVIALGIIGFIVYCYVIKVKRRKLYWNNHK
jgi:spermidine/putrescine-binding protein